MGRRVTDKVQRALALCALLGAVAAIVVIILQAPAPVHGAGGRSEELAQAPVRSLQRPSVATPGAALERSAPTSLRALPWVVGSGASTVGSPAEARAWLGRAWELIAGARYDEARASC